MNTPQKFSPELLSLLAEKLHPSHFPRMSRVMAGIVGFIVEADFTEPAIADIIVSSTGVVMVGMDGEFTSNTIIVAYEDFLRNGWGFFTVGGFIRTGGIEPQGRFSAKVG